MRRGNSLGKGQTGTDVIPGQLWMGLEDFLLRVPRRQITQHGAHGNARAAHHRFPVAHIRMRFDSILLHASNLSPLHPGARHPARARAARERECQAQLPSFRSR